MPSIAEYKKNLILKKRLKSDPVSALGAILGESKDDRFGGYFFAAMQDMVTKITEQAIKDLLSNEKMLISIASAASRMVKQGRDGTNGLKGDKGERGDQGPAGKDGRDGKDGNDGKDGKTPEKYIDYFTQADIEEFAAKARVGALEGSGMKIIDEINKAPEDKKIPASRISGLETAKGKDKREGTTLHRGGLKLVWNTQLSGTINGINTIFTIPAGLPDPKDNKYLVSARGVLKDVDSGDFTISSDNRTVTFTSAPPSGSARPRIPLYHGK
jgi:hypothetical protein